MMDSATFIAGLAVFLPWLGYTLIKIDRALHILQLNGYFNRRYLRWVRNNKQKVSGAKEFIPLATVLLVQFNMPIAGYIIWALFYLLLIAAFIKQRKKEGEKKKLVYTSRVKRLLITTALLLLAVLYLLVTMMFAGSSVPVVLLVLMLFNILCFFIVAVANLLNWPVEKAINRWYYNDAKRILQNRKDLKVIGITGSYGKTSTKQFLNTILSERFNVLATPESYNTTMGVVLTTRTGLKPLDSVYIVEMGARGKGDIKEICELVSPQMAILTAIGEQHLETFGDIENIKAAKNELLQSLDDGGVAFVNYDDENIRSLPLYEGVRYIRYGIYADNLDYRARDIKFNSRGSSFIVSCPDGQEVLFKTRLLGRHNIYNILAGVAVACHMGMEIKSIVYAVRRLEPVEHRLQIKKSGGITIIDDAFNSNPVGSKMALEVLKQIEGGRKIMITPGMVELGEREYILNKQFGQEAARSCDYIILVGPKQTLPVREGLEEENYPENQYFVARNLKEALEHLKTIAVLDSVVLFENDLPDTYNE